MSDNLDFDETNFMIEPLILEIYLNKSKYKDRLLINDLRKKAQIVSLPELDKSSFFVKAEEVEEILYTRYKKDILNFDSTAPSDIPNSANSIFFLEAAMREFTDLKYFRVHVSENEEIESMDKKAPVFDYKIMHSRIDLVSKVTPDFYQKCLQVFGEIQVYNPTIFEPKPYFELAVRDLFFRLHNHLMQFEKDDEEYLDVLEVMSIFGQKLERDNSTVLVIMKK